MAIKDDVAANLRNLRRESGMLINEVAARAGVSGNTMLRHEHGFDMTVTQLLGYASALGCSVYDLLYGPIPDGPLSDENDDRFDAEIEMLGRQYGIEVVFTTREQIYEEMRGRSHEHSIN